MTALTHQNKKKTGRGLKGKLILSMLLVGVIPLLIGLVMAFLQGTEEIQEVSGASFVGLANETARKLDLVVGEEVAKNAQVAKNRLIIAELETRRDRDLSQKDLATRLAQEETSWNAKDEQLVQNVTEGTLAKLLRRYYIGATVEQGQAPPVVTRSATRAFFITDIHGTLVASLHSNVSYSHRQAPWWIGAFHKGVGKTYIENVQFDERLKTYTFSISSPILDSIGYQAIGVLHRIYDAKEFFDPSITPIRFGETGHVMLIDSQGFVINCPILPTGNQVPDKEVISLVTSPQPGWVKAPSDGHGGEGTSIIGYASLPGISQITQDSTNRSWHTFVWQSSEELFAPIRHLLTWISVFGLVAVGLLVSLGFFAASRIVTPIRQLQKAAGLIGRGELKEPISIKTGDEIEDLADEINRMNAQLEVAFAGLSDQVEQKTQEVQSLQKATDQILESVSTPIVMVDRDEQIQYANRAAKETFHLKENQLVNGQPHNLFDMLLIDDTAQEPLRQELQVLMTASSDHSKEHKDFSQHSSVSLYDPLDPKLGDKPNPARKEVHIGSNTYRYEWFQVTAHSQKDERIGLIFRDTTEESQRQDQLIQAEKSGSLGVLTAGIGHELNNPLFGILGLGEAIQDETDLNKIRSYAKDIVQHGKRMATTIKDFTGLVRADEKERYTTVDLNDQLEHALNLMPKTPEQGDDLVIQTHFHPLPALLAIPDELQQAFMNILLNAVQAMKAKGTLTVSTETTDATIRIHIQDTGRGISKVFLAKVFDPFFTNKGQGEGMGLGLTVARRIIKKYGGHIFLESDEGKGTICTITFPIPEGVQPKKEAK